MTALPHAEESMVIILSRYDTIPERDRQTDRQTDGQNSYINIARQHCCAARDKKSMKLVSSLIYIFLVSFYSSDVIMTLTVASGDVVSNGQCSRTMDNMCLSKTLFCAIDRNRVPNKILLRCAKKHRNRPGTFKDVSN